MTVPKRSSEVNDPQKIKAQLESEAEQNVFASKTGRMHQMMAAGVIAIQYLVFSMPLGYSAIFLPQIRDPMEPINMDLETETWFGECLERQRFRSEV